MGESTPAPPTLPVIRVVLLHKLRFVESFFPPTVCMCKQILTFGTLQHVTRRKTTKIEVEIVAWKVFNYVAKVNVCKIQPNLVPQRCLYIVYRVYWPRTLQNHKPHWYYIYNKKWFLKLIFVKQNSKIRDILVIHRGARATGCNKVFAGYKTTSVKMNDFM